MQSTRAVWISAIVVALAAVCQPLGAGERQPARRGPLRVSTANPRYFTDDSGKAILLTGSHTWNNLVDMAVETREKSLDYDAYLDWMAGYHHNFMRLWAWELLTWDTNGNRENEAQLHRVAPHPWARTGPGNALDGQPKFDLTRYNDEYFQRLRTRVQAAGEHGIYVSIMLFEGWGLQFSPDAWRNHPMHPKNNVNGINGDLDGDGKGLEIHTGRSEEITKLQRAYICKVIDTVNDLDNVLYEISNENHPASTEWQYDMIRFVKDYETTKGKRHPVGMTFQYKGGSNETLMKSPADWISPNPEGGYRDDPPAGDGTKVIVSDTDHLWGIGGNSTWVWKSFLRGLNPIFMDPYDGKVLSKGFDKVAAEGIRKSMGQVLDWSRRVNLAAMQPREDLASTRYCLADEGAEFLVFLPKGTGQVTVRMPAGRYQATWFDPASGAELSREPFAHGGGPSPLEPPFEGESLLYLRLVK
ncbi:MAG: DUF6298 domain-containing protein [Thermoguttaceae bacterium]